MGGRLQREQLCDVPRGQETHDLLIVDHDMKLIMSLCDRILVLNKGLLIAEGSPLEIQESRDVQEAYLGRRHARRAGQIDRP